MNVINPATEQVIAAIPADNADTVARKYEGLAVNQPAWAATPLAQRVAILKRFIDELAQNRTALAETLTSEVGKPLAQATNEVNGAISRVKWLCENAETYLSDERMDNGSGTHEEVIGYEPLGVVCSISAWNYPYLVGVNVLVPALLAGNAVLYKPSEFALQTGISIVEHLVLAGVPSGVIQVAIGAGDVGKLLLEKPFDGFFFTGSYPTGKFIYEQVAPKMVPCQLELGGKDALYIADDVADITAVAGATADGAFYNNGQSCCSVERIYVHQAVYDDYVSAFVAQVKAWKVGPPTEDDVYFGPLTRDGQRAVLAAQIADALEKGATLLTGGKPIAGTGYYFEPTVLVNVDHSMSVMRAESFGPIIGIQKVANDEEAVGLMQDTDYGLTGGVYAASRERASTILKKLTTGSVYWNCCDRVSAALPWSGRKHSGIGATLSHQGIRAFTRPKAWHLNS